MERFLKDTPDQIKVRNGNVSIKVLEVNLELLTEVQQVLVLSLVNLLAQYLETLIVNEPNIVVGRENQEAHHYHQGQKCRADDLPAQGPRPVLVLRLNELLQLFFLAGLSGTFRALVREGRGCELADVGGRALDSIDDIPADRAQPVLGTLQVGSASVGGSLHKLKRVDDLSEPARLVFTRALEERI